MAHMNPCSKGSLNKLEVSFAYSGDVPWARVPKHPNRTVVIQHA